MIVQVPVIQKHNSRSYWKWKYSYTKSNFVLTLHDDLWSTENKLNIAVNQKSD
jgi:hypothetical protein